jgi:hypothetical protein
VVLVSATPSFAQSAISSNANDTFAGDASAILRPDGSHADASNLSAFKREMLNSQAVCYTMRTYVAVREAPDSDSTRIAGYHECLPSWKLDMRTSEWKGKNPQAPQP